MKPTQNNKTKAKADWKRILAEEDAIVDFTEEIVRRMEQVSLTKTALAEKLGVDPAFVSKLLGGNNNFTIRTMAGIALALDSKVRLALVPIKAATKWNTATISTSHISPVKIAPSFSLINRVYASNERWGQYDYVVTIPDSYPLAHEPINSEAALSV